MTPLILNKGSKLDSGSVLLARVTIVAGVVLTVGVETSDFLIGLATNSDFFSGGLDAVRGAVLVASGVWRLGLVWGLSELGIPKV